jgi:hypothetical protein
MSMMVKLVDTAIKKSLVDNYLNTNIFINLTGIDMNTNKVNVNKPIDKNHIGKVSVDQMLEQLRNTENCVTRSVLVDCIVDRLKRRDYV